MNPIWTSVLFLALSSSVMTVAWYAHLRFKDSPLWLAIIGSWFVALLEYSFQVPANRIGHGVLSAAQLKIVAEFFGLTSFIVFSVLYLKEPMSLNYLVSFGLIFAAVVVAFWGPFK